MSLGQSLLDERKQICIDLVLEGRAHTVWRTLIDLESCILDQLGRQHSRISNRHNLIVIAMEDECWNVDLLEILGGSRSRKNALMQKYDAGRPAIIPWSQNDSHTPSENFAPGRL